MEAELQRYFASTACDSHTTASHLADSGKTVRWIPLVFLDEHGRVGITDNGSWIYEGWTGATILRSPQSLLQIEVMLEKPLSIWYDEVAALLKTSDVHLSPWKVFPFAELVSAVLSLAISDYWVGLALQWYSGLPAETQAALQEQLVAVQGNRMMSQRVRHDAGKYLARLGWRTPLRTCSTAAPQESDQVRGQ